MCLYLEAGKALLCGEKDQVLGDDRFGGGDNAPDSFAKGPTPDKAATVPLPRRPVSNEPTW